MASHMQDTARKLYACGFTVIPLGDCNAGKNGSKEAECRKKPHFDQATGKAFGWGDFKNNRPSPEKIEELWKKWPNANIGLVCGVESGLLVADLDTPEAESWWRENFTMSGVETQTGHGKHIWYRPPGKEHINLVRKFRSMLLVFKRISDSKGVPVKIDLQNEGHYVVGPESIHPSGVTYTLNVPIDESLPDRLPVLDPDEMNRAIRKLEGLTKKEAAPMPSPATPTTYRGLSVSPTYGSVALDGAKEMVRAANKGSRNEVLNTQAFKMGQLVAGGYIDEDMVRKELGEVALAVGLTPGEVGKTISSGMEKGKLTPRTPAPRQDGKASHPVAGAEPQKTQKIFKLLTSKELLARPRPKWIIKNLLPDLTTGVIWGESKAGKSFFSLLLAYSIANGWESFMGHKVKQTRPVVYFCLEGEGDFRNRVEAIEAWAVSHGLNIDGRFYYCDDTFNFEQNVDDFIATCGLTKEDHPVVIVDTLARSKGSAEENSNTDMQRILDKMQELARGLEGVCLAFHHSGKDASKGSRGAYTIIASVDVSLQCSRNGDIRTWRTEKVKGGRDELTGNFILEPVKLGLDEDGDEIESCVAVPTNVEPPASKQKVKLKGEKKRALDILLRLTQKAGEKREHKTGETSFALHPKIAGEDWRLAYVSERVAENKDAGKESNERNLGTSWSSVARELATMGIVELEPKKNSENESTPVSEGWVRLTGEGL